MPRVRQELFDGPRGYPLLIHISTFHRHHHGTNRAPVRKVLWREIRRAYGKAKVPLGGEILQTELRIADRWYAFGFSPDEPTNFSGLHAEYVLVIIDEATGVAADM